MEENGEGEKGERERERKLRISGNEWMVVRGKREPEKGWCGLVV